MEFLNLVDHLISLLKPLAINVLMGYGYFFFIQVFILAVSFRHKKEIWEAVRGADGKLEMPELIILLSLILYVCVILGDVFLQIKPSDGVFWSLDSIILFALTGRIVLNRFNNNNNNGLMNEAPTQVSKKTDVNEEEKSKNNDQIDESLLA